MNILKIFGLLFAIAAFFDAATTMMGTKEILTVNSSDGDKTMIVAVAFVFALLITIIVASSGYLLEALNINAFKKFVVLPIVISAFFYDFYTSAYGVAGMIIGRGAELFEQEPNMIAIVIFLSLFMTLSPFIALKLWSVKE